MTCDASTQTFKYQRLASPSQYAKVKLYCENCEFYWLHHENDHLLLYYYGGLKYCLECRHTLDEFDAVKTWSFQQKKDKWIQARYSVRRFKCCECGDVRRHHHLGDKHYGRIPVLVNAAVPRHQLCIPCYNYSKLADLLSPDICRHIPCRQVYRAGWIGV